MIIHTVGHSTRSLEQLQTLLAEHGITLLADVRTVPRSRYMPQFNAETLPAELNNISYVHLPGLGGLRKPQPDSVNTGWRHPGFRGYADYMQTPEFTAALDELIQLAQGPSVALMCAEAVPWRCHRKLLADALTVRGVEVRHIMDNQAPVHSLTPFARVENNRLTYPSDQIGLDL